MNNELNEINKKNYKNLTPFKGWVIENFPFIEADFDAITNYQLICKVTEYLNTVIYNQNQVQNLSNELVDGYNNLLNYVNNYFNNLDVQEEINNKLDDLVNDGTLTTLIGNYVQPLINEQNEQLNSMQTQINSVTNYNPLVASSVSDMTDTTKIYVNTSDGHWYWYDGDSWEDGGVYQGIEIPNDSISPIKTTFMKSISLIPDDNWISGKILNYTSGNEQNFPNGSYSKTYVEIPTGKTKIIYEAPIGKGLHVYFYDDDYTFIESISVDVTTFGAISEGAKYFRIGFAQSPTRQENAIILYLEDYLNGLNIYENAYIKDKYNSLNSKNIIYNQEKLNILPYPYNSSITIPTIEGNEIKYSFVRSNANQTFIGFALNWNIKANDTLKVEIIGDTKPNPSSFGLYATPPNSLQVNLSDAVAIFNCSNYKGSITLTSEIINALYNNTMYITYKLEPTTETITYDYKIKVTINDDYYYFVDLLDSIKNQTPHTYKAMYLGDSITALAGDRAWWTYFNSMLNIDDYQNVAVAGAHLTDYNDTVYDGNPVYGGPDDNHNNVLGNQVQKIINNQATYITPDIIMIAIGTNAGINTTLNDAYNEYYNNDGSIKLLANVNRQTSAGAFRYCNEKLHELYPNAMIVWCTPIQAVNTTRNVKNVIAWGDNLKLLCSIGSNYCIDTEKCGICGINEISGANGEDLIDGLHPNSHGAKKMGTFNACEFKKFLDRIDEYSE